MGSPISLISTAAFESKRIYVPSLRRVSLRIRTTTQRTTLPFLIAESGASSFTLAVIMSPSPARSPRSPPRGKMHCSRRAPLLSATSRIVRIPIINLSPQTRPLVLTPRLLLLLFLYRCPLLAPRVNADGTQVRRHLHGLAHDFAQLPAL